VDFGGLAGPESPRSLANRITRLERESALLSTARPHLAAGLARLVATIIDGLTPSPSAPTHGDLKPEHVFIDGDTVSLIDFDFLQASDRVLDVLKMEKHLASPRRRVSSSTGGAEASARRFVEAYLAHAAHDARARLALYRAMDTIGDASRVVNGQDADWQQRGDELVGEAAAFVRKSGAASAASA